MKRPYSPFYKRNQAPQRKEKNMPWYKCFFPYGVAVMVLIIAGNSVIMGNPIMDMTGFFGAANVMIGFASGASYSRWKAVAA